MKSCSPQALSCILRQYLTGEFFSFGLRDVVNLSTTFFIQRFFKFFIWFIKNAFFNVFYSWGQHFLHLWFEGPSKAMDWNPTIAITRILESTSLPYDSEGSEMANCNHT